MSFIFFAVLSGIAIGAALLVVFQKDIVFSALYLTLTLLCVAGIFFLLSAPFVAALQILVYAGAIMVLFTFVIMMVSEENTGEADAVPFQKTLVTVLAVIVFLEARAFMKSAHVTLQWSAAEYFPLKEFGRKLYQDTAFAFEITSLILLAAIVGVLALTRRDKKES